MLGCVVLGQDNDSLVGSKPRWNGWLVKLSLIRFLNKDLLHPPAVQPVQTSPVPMATSYVCGGCWFTYRPSFGHRTKFCFPLRLKESTLCVMAYKEHGILYRRSLPPRLTLQPAGVPHHHPSWWGHPHPDSLCRPAGITPTQTNSAALLLSCGDRKWQSRQDVLVQLAKVFWGGHVMFGQVLDCSPHENLWEPSYLGNLVIFWCCNWGSILWWQLLLTSSSAPSTSSDLLKHHQSDIFRAPGSSNIFIAPGSSNIFRAPGSSTSSELLVPLTSSELLVPLHLQSSWFL